MNVLKILYVSAISRHSVRAAALVGSTVCILSVSNALADQGKANNADNLELGSSWVSNTAPGSGDMAVFNSTLDGSVSSFTLGADQSWLGIQITNPAAALVIAGSNSLTIGSGGINLFGAVVPLSINVNLFTSADQLWIDSAAAPLTIGGVINSSNALTLSGGTFTFANANFLSGPLTINSGKLLLENSAALGTPSSLLISTGATLDLGGENLSIAAPAGTGTIDNSAAGSATLTFSSGGTFAGVIANSGGPLSLIKAGTGNLVLGPVNTFSGTVTINSGSILVTNSQSLKNVSSITIAVSGGLSLANGVVLDRNVITAGDSTGKEVFNNPANSSATLSGSLSAPSRQFRVSTPASGTLTLLGGISIPTNANAFFTGGNIILAGTSALTTGVATLGVGRSSTPTTLLVKDNASVTPANGLILANSGGANPSVALTIQDHGSVNLKTRTLDFNGSGAITTLNLNGGSLTTGSFVKTAAAASTFNLNGGKLIAGAAGTSFLPSFPGLTVTIGAGGALIDSAGFDLTVASPIGAVSNDGGLAKIDAGTLTFTGPLSYHGITSIVGGSIDFSGAVTHNVGAIRGTSAQVDYGTTLVSAASSGTSSLSSLTLAGSPGAWSGTLDVSNNSLVIEASDDADKAAKLVTLADQIASGRNGGLWNGPGITSSAAQAAAIAHGNSEFTTLAVVPNDQLNIPLTNFAGVPVDSESILVKYTYAGDANLDGVLNIDDYLALDHGFLNHLTGWQNGDFNSDGVINFADYALIDRVFVSQGSPLAANLFSEHAAEFGAPYLAAFGVPEPASLCILVAGSLAALRRKKRHI